MNNVVFGKTMEYMRKHAGIKFVTTKTRRNQLITEPNYHTTKLFLENLLAIEMKKKKENKHTQIQIFMSKPVYIKTEDIYLDIAKNFKTKFDI